MVTLDELRKKNKERIEALQQKHKESNTKKDYSDDRFWKPTIDKSGNGSALIRFLPCLQTPLPYVEIFKHSFHNPYTGKYYINDCLNTIGMNDPVNDFNLRMFNSKDESKIDIVKSMTKWIKKYVANILVIKDPGNPENEGKVFLYEYGVKIQNKIDAKTNPEFDGQEVVDIYDLENGCNFNVRIKKVAGYPNYDNSEFSAPSAIVKNDEDTSEIISKCYDIREFKDPSKFKSYEELKNHFDSVMGFDTSDPSIDPTDPSTFGKQPTTKPKTVEESVKKETSKDDDIPFDVDSGDDDDDDDDIMSKVKSLIDEDDD